MQKKMKVLIKGPAAILNLTKTFLRANRLRVHGAPLRVGLGVGGPERDNKSSQIRFFRHTADVEFEVYGRDLPELFESAAFALFDVMTDIRKVNGAVMKEIAAKGRDLEALLYDFLEQFLILHDSENLVFSRFKVLEVAQTPEGYSASAEAWGEEFDEGRHEGRTAVKAVTYHDMKVGQKKDGSFFAHIVLDI